MLPTQVSEEPYSDRRAGRMRSPPEKDFFRDD